LNADAWPVGNAIERLVEFADSQPQAGIVGPRLVNSDGTLQPSLRGFPSRWRLATEYLFLRWLAPHSTFLNAFYGAGFDYASPQQAEFLMGAALLLRRAAIDAVGAFDTRFFMFSEEVDLCYRMQQAGWAVEFFPGATFVHVGGASTRQDWASMYREQLRGHLRFFAKHHGIREAERTRTMLVWAFRFRSLVFRGHRRRLTRETARWLASGDVTALLEQT
jgi:GT2 family glycosyltransferase